MLGPGGDSLSRFLYLQLTRYNCLDVIARGSLCSGVTLILISNIIYILNNYTVSWFGLHATEVALVRGVFQVVGFGVVLLLKHRKLGKLEHPEGKNYPPIVLRE